MGVGVRRAGGVQEVVVVKDVVFLSWRNTKGLPWLQRNIVLGRQCYWEIFSGGLLEKQ